MFHPFYLCLTLLLTALCLPACHTNRQRTLGLYVFDTGKITAFDASLLSPGVNSGKVIRLGNPSFLILHPKGTLIWDSGHPDSLTLFPEGVKEEFALMEHSRSLLSQLESIGVNPEEISYLALSHMHADHAGNANYFHKATLLIQQEEYEAAFGPRPEKFLFNRHLYSQLTNVHILKGDYDVFGDGKVVIKKAPGHSPGHQVLFVRLPKQGPLLISGDLYHHAGNREQRGLPVFNFDKAQSIESMESIEAFIKQQKAALWIQHDPVFADSIHYAPYLYR